jgi:adenine C2-methylase RlmN of 23S rRNA A2503 and tRNA A37
MTDLPEDFRNKLAEKYCVFQTKVDSITQTDDGTEKLLIRLLDKNVIGAQNKGSHLD